MPLSGSALDEAGGTFGTDSEMSTHKALAVMATAEHWPPAPWMEPWKPSGDQVMPGE